MALLIAIIRYSINDYNSQRLTTQACQAIFKDGPFSHQDFKIVEHLLATYTFLKKIYIYMYLYFFAK